jgi:hypothetical protein
MSKRRPSPDNVRQGMSLYAISVVNTAIGPAVELGRVFITSKRGTNRASTEYGLVLYVPETKVRGILAASGDHVYFTRRQAVTAQKRLVHQLRAMARRMSRTTGAGSA